MSPLPTHCDIQQSTLERFMNSFFNCSSILYISIPQVYTEPGKTAESSRWQFSVTSDNPYALLFSVTIFSPAEAHIEF